MFDHQEGKNTLEAGINDLAAWAIKEVPAILCPCGGVLLTDEKGKTTCDLCRLSEPKRERF